MSTILVIQQYHDYMLGVLRFSERTVSTQRSILVKFFRDIGIEYDQLTIDELDATCAALMETGRKPKPLKPSSINSLRRTLRGFYRYCGEYRKDDTLAYTLIRDIKEPKRVIRFLHPEDVADVINSTDDYFSKTVIAFLYETGVRLSELVNLQLEDIDFRNNEVRIIGKGNKERIVYITEGMASLIRNLVRERRITSGRIFHDDRLVEQPKAIRRRIQEEFGRCGYTVTPHMLRHTFATTIYRNGADLKTVKELLGHTRLDTTDRYLHFTSSELKINHQKFLTKLAY